MPELPEVETSLRGIKPYIINKKIVDVIVRHPTLRWPIPPTLKAHLLGQTLRKLERRAKYLLFTFDNGTLILHLGMSGKVRVLTQTMSVQKHDHLDICFTDAVHLRFTDPRRFGAVLWTNDDPQQHPLIVNIGPEPLTADFSGEYLWTQARDKKVPVKVFIMNSATVAGVGNIYATEALFQARISPLAPAGKISRAAYDKLAQAIKHVLEQAINKGGTTLKDYRNSDGAPGYFRIELQAYGREGKPCPRCKTKLKSERIGQRATVYCPHCQK